MTGPLALSVVAARLHWDRVEQEAATHHDVAGPTRPDAFLLGVQPGAATGPARRKARPHHPLAEASA